MVVTLPIGLPGWNLNPLLSAFCTAAAFDLDPVLMITTSLGTISRQLNRSRHVGHLASLPSRPPSCCSNRKHIDNFSHPVSRLTQIPSKVTPSESPSLSLALCLSLFWETVGYSNRPPPQNAPEYWPQLSYICMIWILEKRADMGS